MKRDLTEKQRRFVEAFMGEARGNGTEAARLAGYEGDDVTLAAVAYENLRKPLIREAVAKRQGPGILRRKKLQQFWSEMVHGEEAARDRLKASELLAKSLGLFLDRHELSTPPGRPLAIRAEHLTDDQLAAVIAQGMAKKDEPGG